MLGQEGAREQSGAFRSLFIRYNSSFSNLLRRESEHQGTSGESWSIRRKVWNIIQYLSNCGGPWTFALSRLPFVVKRLTLLFSLYGMAPALFVYCNAL